MITAAQILANGGATWRPGSDAAQPQNGYMVSVRDAEYTLPVSEFSDSDVERYTAKYFNTVNQSANRYFGAWVNDGVVFLDVSVHLSNRDDAIRRGVAEKQLSIFDLNVGRDVSLAAYANYEGRDDSNECHNLDVA